MPADEISATAPVACTLSATDMGSRLTRIRLLTRTYLRGHDMQGSTLRLTYGLDAAAELAAIVELERECCAFLAFHLTEGPGALQLLIVGPPQGGTDAQWLFSQFVPDASPSSEAPACGCGKG